MLFMPGRGEFRYKSGHVEFFQWMQAHAVFASPVRINFVILLLMFDEQCLLALHQ